MGILCRNPVLYIGFPSSYISRYFTSVKFVFSLVASIITYLAMYEVCFRDRGIDWLCLKCVSGIGELIGCVQNMFQR